MRASLLLGVLLVAGTTASPVRAQAGVSPNAPSSPAARELYRLEDQWAAALVKRDVGFFRRTLHPDYVYSDERGVFTKDQVIAEQIGADTVQYATNEDMRAHIHRQAAVVTGILIVRGHGPNGPFEHRYRYTDTWVRAKSGWLMIASQDYEMPKR